MSKRRRAITFFGLTPEIVAVSTCMFLIGCGENLWRRFLPKYLQALGAPISAIGLFGTAEDFLDGVYQYPGGWMADRYGRRFALMLFISVAAVGYAVYFALPAWPLAFVGLALVMAWTSMASPTLFAVVGDALPKTKRTMGFTVQSILRRVPIVLAPVLGGLAVASFGIRDGVRLGLGISIAMAAVTIAVASRIRIPVIADATPITVKHVWRAFPSSLRWLLLSDVFIRACDGLVDVFLVLYAINVIGIGAPAFGTLIAVQALTTIVVQIPSARLSEGAGKKPFVAATFVAFAAFPLAIVTARSFHWLILAFVVGGLRELGEPARKALIVDFAEPALRGRVVGLYYLAAASPSPPPLSSVDYSGRSAPRFPSTSPPSLVRSALSCFWQLSQSDRVSPRPLPHARLRQAHTPQLPTPEFPTPHSPQPTRGPKKGNDQTSYPTHRRRLRREEARASGCRIAS